MNILNNKNKRTSIFKALALCLFAAVSLTLASCDDDMDIQQSYPFTVETMPVPKELKLGETAEIRCELVCEGEFDGAVYTIRYFQYDGEDTLKLDNGATAVIDNCRAACYGYDQRAEVFGTKGCVAISNDSDSNAVYSCKDGVIAEKPMFFFLERYMMAYANEVDQFIEAIVNDTPTPVNANDGLQPVLIGLAAKKSVDEHRPVKIAEIRAQYGL